MSRALLVVATIAAVLLGVGGAAAACSSDPPDFGPNVYIFDPSMPTSQIQATRRRHRHPAGRQRDGHAALRAAVQARHLRHGRQPAHLPGRLLHRGGRLGRVADRRHDQRPRRRLQPVPGPGQLHRAGQLLALAVEPDDQRHGARPAAGPRATSGRSRRRRRCGGSTSPAATSRSWTTAPPDRSTRAAASSPTRRPASSSTGRSSSSSCGTAASAAGPTASGTRSSPASQGAPPQSFSTTPYDPPPYTTLPTSPVTRERPFLYVDASGSYNVFVPALRTNSSGTTGPTGRAGHVDPARPSSSSPGRPTARTTINKALARGPEPDLHARRLPPRPDDQGQRADTVVLGLGFPTLVARQRRHRR